MPFDIGQRVTFRSLQWEVEDVRSDSTLVLFGRDHENRGHHAHVVLGLENIERTEVPTLEWTLGDAKRGWDPLKWHALHHAFRLTLSHGRGNLASVDWGRLILEPYQLVPLQRIENLPFPRLLLADDTGLGKTAEAGLILFRLLQRRRADRILVLCRARPEPERWRDELREKFGIDMTVINDGEDYARLRRETPSHLNVFGHLSRVAMSMYFAAPSRRGSHIVDDLAHVRWDVVIVDEAHHLAERGDSTKRLAELGRVASETSEALLLLTATPHDGKAESFASLLRLLDPYLVVDPDALDSSIVRPMVVRRLKGRVIKSDGTRFLRRRIHPLLVEGTKAENWLDKGLRGYCKQLREGAKALKKAGERNRAMGASFLETFLRRRLASSVFACAASIQNRLNRLAGVLAPRDEVEPLPDRDTAPLEASEFDLPSGKSEKEVLEDLLTRAKRIPEGDDEKVKSLQKLLARILDKPGEKVVVFTEFVDTLDMLARVIVREGWAELHPDPKETRPPSTRGYFFRYEGATARNHREMIRRRFLEDPQVRILLATDAASESINLHKGCNHLIHMEAVWNPNRYEQRNGRIDRYGQVKEPQIYLLINSHSIEERIARVGYEKLERIADQLGSVSNVLPLASGIDVDEYLDRFGEEEVEQAEREIDRRLDEAKAQVVEAEKADGTADLVRGDPFEDDELRRIERSLKDSRRFVPEFSDVQQFLEVFLRAEGGKLDPDPKEQDVCSIVVPTSLREEVGTERIPRATFLRDLAVREADTEEGRRIEFLSPGHPLVRAALRRTRGWVYHAGFASRVSYRRMNKATPPGLLFTFASRFVDARGEAVHEAFDAVYVGLDGKVSTGPDADMERFIDRGLGGNLSDAERPLLKSRFAPAFDAAHARAVEEARRRAAELVKDLEGVQRRISEDALIRLGRWKQTVEERLRKKHQAAAPAVPVPTQYDVFGEVAKELARQQRERERRQRQFQREQEDLLRDEQKRRDEIRQMESVRLDSLDAIGALALVPEGMK